MSLSALRVDCRGAGYFRRITLNLFSFFAKSASCHETLIVRISLEVQEERAVVDSPATFDPFRKTGRPIRCLSIYSYAICM